MEKQELHLIPLSAILIASIAIFFSVSGTKPPQTSAEATRHLAAARNFPRPEIQAHAYIIKIAGNPTPLLKQREWKVLAPASLTKLLTTVVATEILPENTEVKFSKEARAVEEKRAPVAEEDVFSRDDMMRFALIMSANDAAAALAEYAGGELGGNSFEERAGKFTDRMNQKAAKIGMQFSHFENSTGLDEDYHSTTAQDLAILGEYILKNHPEIWEMTKTAATTVVSKQGNEYEIKSTNELLNEFPALAGGKTGFTDKAKGALMLIYPLKNGEKAIIVILGSEDRFGDGRKILRWLDTF